MAEQKVNGVKGDRSMSRGFIAQYAAEAALQTSGVVRLAPGVASLFRRAIGLREEGAGVQVFFDSETENAISLTVYPVVAFGLIVPEVAWAIQENVKADVERYTDLIVETVNVHVMDIAAPLSGKEGEKKEHA